MSLYERINQLCKNNHITGKELGEKLDLKKSPLTDWKNGKSKPTADQIKRICEIFAISSDYILFGKSSKQLSKQEQEIIESYRNCSPERQAIIRELLNIPEETLKSSQSKVG